MAKCIICTAMNAAAEAKKHPNATTHNLAAILERRSNQKHKSNRYCRFHSRTGTGQGTMPEAKAKIPQLLAQDKAEREAAEAAKLEATDASKVG